MKGGPLTCLALVPKPGREFVAKGPGGVGQITSWSEMAASQDVGLGELTSSFRSLPLVRTQNEVFWMAWVFGLYFCLVNTLCCELRAESQCEFAVDISGGGKQPGAPDVEGIGIPAPGGTRGLGWKSSTRVPRLYSPFTGDCKMFCIDSFSSYLNVDTYRSINRAWKSSWFFYEHSASLFLSCVLHRTSQHQESNLLWMIRNTFFSLVFQKAVHKNWMFVHRVVIFHI